jgi:protein ATS1
MNTRLYGLGSNSSGQLGIGHYEDVDVPTQCQFVINAGSYAEYQEDGDRSMKSHVRISPQPPWPIRKVVAGGNHTLVLCQNGAVYAAGNPEALGDAARIGWEHFKDLKESERMDLTPYFKRVMWMDAIHLLEIFVDVSATWSASFFVVAPQILNHYVAGAGQIWACGKGDKGELGAGKEVTEAKKPVRIAVFGSKSGIWQDGDREVPEIPGLLAGIWSGMGHTVTYSTDGVHVFGWGSCRKGQLGEVVRDEKIIWEPREVADDEIRKDLEIDRIIFAAVGRDFTFLGGTHGKGEKLRTKWKLLGENAHLKDKNDAVNELFDFSTLALPGEGTRKPGRPPFASWSNLYILDRGTASVKGLGRNDRGQLPPDGLPQLINMAAGSEHCVGQTIGGNVVTWGWGEHGNCGRKSDDAGLGWSVLSLPIAARERVDGVGAGCATTFIWTLQA